MINKTTSPYPMQVRLKFFMTNGSDFVEDITINGVMDKYSFYELYLDTLAEKEVAKVQYFSYRDGEYKSINFSQVLRSIMNLHSRGKYAEEFTKEVMELLDSTMDKVVV